MLLTVVDIPFVHGNLIPGTKRTRDVNLLAAVVPVEDDGYLFNFFGALRATSGLDVSGTGRRTTRRAVDVFPRGQGGLPGVRAG